MVSACPVTVLPPPVLPNCSQEVAREAGELRGDLEALAADAVELRRALADSQARRQVRGWPAAAWVSGLLAVCRALCPVAPAVYSSARQCAFTLFIGLTLPFFFLPPYYSGRRRRASWGSSAR